MPEPVDELYKLPLDQLLPTDGFVLPRTLEEILVSAQLSASKTEELYRADREFYEHLASLPTSRALGRTSARY